MRLGRLIGDDDAILRVDADVDRET